MYYDCYGVENITRIMVAGGGLGNGNSYAFIEYDTDEPKEVWYVEFGNNPTRKLLGNDGIEWDDNNCFKVVGVFECQNDPNEMYVCHGETSVEGGLCQECKERLDSVIFLQYALRKAITNPNTPLCKRRLMNEFLNLP